MRVARAFIKTTEVPGPHAGTKPEASRTSQPGNTMATTEDPGAATRTNMTEQAELEAAPTKTTPLSTRVAPVEADGLTTLVVLTRNAATTNVQEATT